MRKGPAGRKNRGYSQEMRGISRRLGGGRWGLLGLLSSLDEASLFGDHFLAACGGFGGSGGGRRGGDALGGEVCVKCVHSALSLGGEDPGTGPGHQHSPDEEHQFGHNRPAQSTEN